MKMRLNEEYIENVKLMGMANNSCIISSDISNIAEGVDISSKILSKV